MREVFIDDMNKINIKELADNTPIFAVKNNIINGMLISEPNGWIIRFPDHCSLSGHFKERDTCIKSAISYGYAIWTQ